MSVCSKNSKKMSDMGQDILFSIVQVIEERHRFLVTSHVKPDGDAMGSLMAMTHILRKMGKLATPVLQDAIPHNCAFVPGVEGILHPPGLIDGYDVGIVVDCAEFSRVGEGLVDMLRRIPVIINIDHHTGTPSYGHFNWVETSASSTCEMLHRLCEALGVAPDPHIATSLYTGLMTDTGSFRFSNTNRHVLELAARLVSEGADPAHIARNIYESAQPQRLHLLAQVLATVEFHLHNRLATAVVTQEMLRASQSTPTDSDGFINELRAVKSVELAIVFREGDNGVVHVSMRSREHVDVAHLARAHGGGGHRQAAAFRTQGTLSEIRKEITGKAMAYLRELTENHEANTS